LRLAVPQLDQLLAKVVTVSLETVKITAAMRAQDREPDAR
jgi:hypothetical protein